MNLKEVLNENKERYIKKLFEILSIDTQVIDQGVYGREKVGQEYIMNLLNEMGAKVETENINQNVIEEAIRVHDEGTIGHNYDERFNVYGTFGEGRGNGTLMFNGHMDTMPPGDIEKWDTNPFIPTIKDDRIFGLGVVDMKAGLLAAVMAVDLLDKAGIELPGEVQITSVVDEEGGGNGSLQAVMSGKKADGVVVCESSDRNVITANRGFIFFEVNVTGKAVRSADKWAGISAIDNAIKLIRSVEELEHKWLMQYKHSLLPAPIINVGTIEGGVAGSIVPDHCKFKMIAYFLPEIMDFSDTVEQVKNAIMNCANGNEWMKKNPPEISIYQSGKPFEVDANERVVKAAQEAFMKVTGTESPIAGDPSGCDARFWYNISKSPTIHFGPGESNRCHTVNEQLEVSEYLDFIQIYAQMILDFFKQ